MLLAVLIAARSLTGPPPLSLPTWVFRVVALALAAGGFLVVQALRAGLPSRHAGEDRAAWWRTNGARAIAVWAVSEGTALTGGVLWFLTGDLLVLAVLAGVGLVSLILSRPGLLAD